MGVSQAQAIAWLDPNTIAGNSLGDFTHAIWDSTVVMQQLHPGYTQDANVVTIEVYANVRRL